MTRHQISEIIEARQREIFEYIGRAIDASPKRPNDCRRLGSYRWNALLGKYPELAEEAYSGFLPVRLGIPQDIVAPSMMQDPSYATAIGLLRFTVNTTR